MITVFEMNQQEIPISDISEQTSLSRYDVPYEIVTIAIGCHVSWEALSTDNVHKFFRLDAKNPPVPVPGDESTLRRLRSVMIGKR